MSMNLTFTICTDCYEKIEIYGFPCLNVFLKACQMHSQGKQPILDTSINPEYTGIIQFLERKKYIVSSEISKHEIVFLPNIKNLCYGTSYYCWCDYEN